MSEKKNVLVSACLLGSNCKYSGGNNKIDSIEELKKVANIVPACPEQLGGFKTPRNPAERIGDKVYSCEKEDVTELYYKGAEETLKLAKLLDCKYALLKEKSPSCGSGKIYDGTFSHTVIDGDGVTGELFRKNGIKMFGESEIDSLIEELTK